MSKGRLAKEAVESGAGILGRIFGKGKKATPKVSKSTDIVRYDPKVAGAAGRKSFKDTLRGGLRPAPLITAAGTLAAASGIYNTMRDRGGAQMDPQDLSWAKLFPAQTQTSQRQTLEDFYNRPDMQYQGGRLPDYVGAAQDIGRRESSALEDYLKEIGGYTTGQAAAMRRAYDELAARSNLRGQEVEQRAGDVGGNIENIYRNLISDQAMDTGDSGALAGLAGPSGEMATGGDVAGLEGRTLVDYLGREGAGQRASLEELAIQQQQQGLASASDLATMARLSEAQARRAQSGRQSEREYQARIAQEEAAAQEAARRMAFNQQRQEQLFAAEIADRQQSMLQEAEGRQIVAQSAQILNSPAGANARALIERDFGTVNTFLNALRTRPELALYYGVIAGA